MKFLAIVGFGVVAILLIIGLYAALTHITQPTNKISKD